MQIELLAPCSEENRLITVGGWAGHLPVRVNQRGSRAVWLSGRRRSDRGDSIHHRHLPGWLGRNSQFFLAGLLWSGVIIDVDHLAQARDLIGQMKNATGLDQLRGLLVTHSEPALLELERGICDARRIAIRGPQMELI